MIGMFDRRRRITNPRWPGVDGLRQTKADRCDATAENGQSMILIIGYVLIVLLAVSATLAATLVNTQARPGAPGVRRAPYPSGCARRPDKAPAA